MNFLKRKTDVFPDENLPNRLFGGIRFADLPICHIKASPNNTIMALTNAAGNEYLCLFLFNINCLKFKFIIRQSGSYTQLWTWRFQEYKRRYKYCRSSYSDNNGNGRLEQLIAEYQLWLMHCIICKTENPQTGNTECASHCERSWSWQNGEWNYRFTFLCCIVIDLSSNEFIQVAEIRLNSED